MNECNDGNVNGLGDCTNEYVNTVIGDSFGFPVPRVWDNPSPSTTFSFDNFRSSLLILFEIVSLEGWIDVMQVATSITGVDSQPQNNASQVNAIFFLIYHLIGGVVILTLFVRYSYLCSYWNLCADLSPSHIIVSLSAISVLKQGRHS